MKHILFITAHRLGDAVIGMGVLAGLMARYPEAEFTVACGPAVTDLFAHMPRCRRVIAIRKSSYNRHWLALWGQVVLYRWGVVVDLRSSPLAWLLWAGRRHVVRGGRQPGLKRVHQAGSLGFEVPHPPSLWLGEREQKQAREILPEGTRWLALAPTAGTEIKMWPPASFATLAVRLREEGFHPVLFYGPGEREARLAAPARAAMPDALDLGGRYGLGEVAALLGRCSLFIGSDSGLMHLAGALNIPTLGLFGPSLASQYAPAGRWAQALSAPGPLGEGVMAHLEVKDVQKAALELYERARSG